MSTLDSPGEPWLPRPRRPVGDPTADHLYHAVGFALSWWEAIETGIAVSYIGIVRTTPFHKDRYFREPSFSKCMSYVNDAILININRKDCTELKTLVALAEKYSFRRNEIAHGRVLSAGEHGHFLCPSVTMNRNFPNGTAAYQYTSDDVTFYGTKFAELAAQADRLASFLGRRE